MTRSIIDEFPYPFELPMAQELLRFLASQYPLDDDALRFVEVCGVDPLEIPRGKGPVNLWHRVLEEAARVGCTREIARATRERYPKNPRAAFLDALLANKPAPVSADLGADGASRPFIGGDEE